MQEGKQRLRLCESKTRSWSFLPRGKEQRYRAKRCELGLHSVPKIHVHWKPQDVISFGNRVFADAVIKDLEMQSS